MHLEESQLNIPEPKLIYLLTWRKVSDKSGMLTRLGFSLNDLETLKQAILTLSTTYEAEYDGKNKQGDFYIVTGPLVGPTGEWQLVSVWIQLYGTSSYNFVTLRPPR